MANEFKIRKGLIVNGSGSTGDLNILDIQGNQGQLFSVTDSLTGSLFSVNDISGIPILEVFDIDKVVMGSFGSNTLVVTGSKVGIGTSTPVNPLDVIGNMSSSDAYIDDWGSISASLAAAGGGATPDLDDVTSAGAVTTNAIDVGNVYIRGLFPTLFFEDEDGGSPEYYLSGGNGYFKIQDNTKGVERFFLNSDGDIGIGNTNPQAILHVSTASIDEATNLMIASSPGSDYYFKVASNGRVHFRGNADTAPGNHDGKTKIHIQHSGHSGSNAESRMIWDSSGGSNQFGWGQSQEDADLTMYNYGTATSMMTFGRTSGHVSFDAEVAIGQDDPSTDSFLTIKSDQTVDDKTIFDVIDGVGDTVFKIGALGYFHFSSDNGASIFNYESKRNLTLSPTGPELYTQEDGNIILSSRPGDSGAYTDRLKISGSGDVVIPGLGGGGAGTTPTNYLGVDNDGKLIKANTPSPTLDEVLTAGSSSSEDAHIKDLYVQTAIIHEGDADTKIVFNIDTIEFEQAGTEVMRITGGELAIGDSSAQAKLHVKADTNDGSSYVFWLENSSNINRMLMFDDGTAAFSYSSSTSTINFNGFANSLIGNYSTVLGNQAGRNNASDVTNPDDNKTLVGYQAGSYATSSYNSVMVGYQSGKFSNLYNNTYIGNFSGYRMVGSDNVIIGRRTGYQPSFDSGVISHDRNIYIGSEVYEDGDLGGRDNENIFIGYRAAYNATASSNNVIIGSYAFQNSDAIIDAEGGNTIIGSQLAMSNADPLSNTVIIGANQLPRLQVSSSGKFQFHDYGDTTFDEGGDNGTMTRQLGVDTNGHVIQTGVTYMGSTSVTFASGTGTFTVSPVPTHIVLTLQTTTPGEILTYNAVTGGGSVTVNLKTDGGTLVSGDRTVHYMYKV